MTAASEPSGGKLDNSAEIIRVLSSTPRKPRTLSPCRADSDLGSLRVQIWRQIGGLGSNTYQTRYAEVILDEDKHQNFAEMIFTVVELRLPNRKIGSRCPLGEATHVWTSDSLPSRCGYRHPRPAQLDHFPRDYERGDFQIVPLAPCVKGPGITLVFRPIDHMVRISLHSLF